MTQIHRLFKTGWHFRFFELFLKVPKPKSLFVQMAVKSSTPYPCSRLTLKLLIYLLKLMIEADAFV